MNFQKMRSTCDLHTDNLLQNINLQQFKELLSFPITYNPAT